MLSSEARVLITVAPMRSPVKEPGPDIKVISVISCQDLPFSCNFSWMKLKSFFFFFLLESHAYVFLSYFNILVGVVVSMYCFL